MGKKIIIKGADFSANAVLPYNRQMDYVFTTDSGQQVVLNFASAISLNNAKVTIQFYDTEAEDSNNRKFLESNGTNAIYLRSVGSTYSAAYNGTGIPDIPKSRGLHVVEMTASKITFDGIDYAISTLGNKKPTVLYIFTSNADIGSAIGTKKINLIKIEDSNNTLIHQLIPVLDLENKACFFDTVTRNLLYATSGDLAAE